MKTENKDEYLWETQSKLEEAVDQLERATANLESLGEFIENTVDGLGTPDDSAVYQSVKSIRKIREDLHDVNSDFSRKVKEFRASLLNEEVESNG